MTKYLIVIEKAKNNYGAFSPDVLGCVATGKTIDETRKNMQEALEFHFEGMAEDGDPIPEPTTLAEYVDVKVPRKSAPGSTRKSPSRKKVTAKAK